MNSSSKTEYGREFERSFGIEDTRANLGITRFLERIGSNASWKGGTTGWFRRLVHRHFEPVDRGCLVLEEAGKVHRFGEDHPSEGSIQAHIKVESPMAYRMMALNGVIGAAEGFMEGHWTSPNPLAVVQFFLQNFYTLKKIDNRRSFSNRIALQLVDRFNRNSVSQAKKNISAHYDLGNEFFELFLDPTMMYSSAVFENNTMTLEQASVAKLDALCKQLELSEQDHLVEIGTGWGGMAIHAASNYGCKVTTTTISREQMEFAQQRIAELGLTDKITVVMRDYRELEGKYDKLVSIEMIEAVGHEYFESYFRKCASLLKPHGLMAIQAITIAEQKYEESKNSVDFIQRYIFPGGCLPSLSVIAQHTAKFTDLNIVSITDITRHYALTLQHWRDAFTAKLSEVRALGFDERFIRMWMFYLVYCEGGFRERSIGVHQIVSAKPNYRDRRI